MSSPYRGKVVAITGGGSGMGREMAIQLASQGSGIAISDVNEEGLKETKRLALQAAEVAGNRLIKISTMKVDVSSQEQVNDWHDMVMREHDGRVDYLINNAGVGVDGTMVMEGNDEYWTDDIKQFYIKAQDKSFEINYNGVVYCCRAFLPTLYKQDKGCIVNIASVNAFFTWPGHSAYTAAKHAVKGFTESLAMECCLKAPHIQISCVFPGGVRTNIVNNSIHHKNRTEELKKFSGIFDQQAGLNADDAAAWILGAVGRGKTRIMVGYDALALDMTHRIHPKIVHNFIEAIGQSLVSLGVRLTRLDDITQVSFGRWHKARIAMSGGATFVFGQFLPVQCLKVVGNVGYEVYKHRYTIIGGAAVGLAARGLIQQRLSLENVFRR